MNISFSPDAYEAFTVAVSKLPAGYTVALLDDGQEVPEGSDLVPGTDVRIVGANAEGVVYLDVDEIGEPVDDVEHLRPWAHIAHVHVY